MAYVNESSISIGSIRNEPSAPSADTQLGGAFHNLADAAHRLAAATDQLLIAQKVYAEANEGFALAMQLIDKEAEGAANVRIPWQPSVKRSDPNA